MTNQKIFHNCIMGLLRMRMDALHYALLAVLVLLVFYAASTYGMFKEGGNNGETEHILQGWTNLDRPPPLNSKS